MKLTIMSICAALALAVFVGLACGQQPSDEPPAAEPRAHLTDADVCPPNDPACSVRDVSTFTLLNPQIDGALFDYDIPTTEELLKLGMFGSGVSPTHIAVLGTPVANTLRCSWRDAVMTNDQREDALRQILGLAADEALPSTARLETIFNQYATKIHTRYRDAMTANFNHLVHGGVLSGSQTLTCYADYTVTQYLLGNGPTTVTVAYDNLADTRSYALYALAHAAGRYGTATKMTTAQYDAANDTLLTDAKQEVSDAITGQRAVVFLAPLGDHSAIAVEAWQVVGQWDVQTIGGVVKVVRYGMDADDPGASEALASFKTRITTAAGSDGMSSERLASANDIRIHYRDIGAYGNISAEGATQVYFSPDQPPVTESAQPTPTPSNKPNIPQNVVLAWNADNEGVWITWDAPSSGPHVEQYVIFRTRDGVHHSQRVLMVHTGNTTTAYLDNQDIISGIATEYTVAAKNSRGQSAYTYPESITPPGEPPPTLTPTPTPTNTPTPEPTPSSPATPPSNLAIDNQGNVTWTASTVKWPNQRYLIRWGSGDTAPGVTDLDNVASYGESRLCDAQRSCSFRLRDFDATKHFLVRVKTRDHEPTDTWVAVRYTP